MSLQPTCPPVHRPEELLNPATPVAGLRAAQSRLQGGQRLCSVYLYQDPPAALAAADRWTITAPPGAQPVAVASASIAALPEPHVELVVAGQPDLARYRVSVDQVGPPAVAFDPLRTWLLVRLRPECPDLGSCFTPPPAPPSRSPSPVTDYRARDWRSLTLALLDYMQLQDASADLSIADPTVTVAELFAHAGDLLHYRLDRVATEAYLETARLRTSVRRHVRLVDFWVGDGTSARTFVHLSVPPNGPDVVVVAGDVAADEAGSALAFTLEEGRTASASRGEIPIYDWSEDACCLPAGSASCVLVRPQPADPKGATWLAAGDRLVFEVVEAGDRAMHARWAHRDPAQPWPTDGSGRPAFRAPLASRTAQVVQLLSATPFEDPLVATGMELTLVEWQPVDALVRDYPVGIATASGIDEVTVVRAEVVPAHHGRVVGGGPGENVAPRPSEGDPPEAPTAAWWLTAAGSPRAGGAGLSRDGAGRPYQMDLTVTLPSTVDVGVDCLPTLLQAPAGSLSVVVDIEDHEPPVVRFRTGAVGQAPPAGSELTARYQIGIGSVGNVPANALSVLEHDQNQGTPIPEPEFVAYLPSVIVARNPVSGTGGTEPDVLDTVRRDAPDAFVAVPRRAVLAADYALAADQDPLVRQAFARRQWAGSWPLMTTVVDLSGNLAGATEEAARAEVAARLDTVRMLGTEVAVISGTPIGLLIALEICVRPGDDPDLVRGDALSLLRPGTAAQPGLFHPSRLALGQAVYTSAVVAAVAGLAAVDAVALTEARRLSEPAGTVHTVLTFGPDEVPVLDDDPQRPDRGRLDVVIRGGR
jgi:hypothetical protein